MPLAKETQKETGDLSPNVRLSTPSKLVRDAAPITGPTIVVRTSYFLVYSCWIDQKWRVGGNKSPHTLCLRMPLNPLTPHSPKVEEQVTEPLHGTPNQSGTKADVALTHAMNTIITYSCLVPRSEPRRPTTHLRGIFMPRVVRS